MSLTFIAEIGMNYNGNPGLAFELIRQAKECGADIAKFQLGWRAGKDEINFLDDERITALKQCTDYHDIELMFSIISRDAFEQIQKFDLPRYKVASRTLIDDLELAEKIIGMGKETFVSDGFWEKNELPFADRSNVRYMYCISKYPTMPWELKDFPKEFGNRYEGYSDHTLGIDTALLAISRGAKIIEKHFTLDKSDVTIRDHALSATPEELRQLITLGREMHHKLELGL